MKKKVRRRKGQRRLFDFSWGEQKENVFVWTSFLKKKFRLYVRRQEMKAKDNSRLISWFCISCPSRSMVVVALKVWLWIEPMTFSRNFHLLSPTFQSLLLGMHIILLVLQIMRNAGNSTVCSSTIQAGLLTRVLFSFSNPRLRVT